MGGAYGTPCSGELQFWEVMRSQMKELVVQVRRVADNLEKLNAVPAGQYCYTIDPNRQAQVETIPELQDQREGE